MGFYVDGSQNAGATAGNPFTISYAPNEVLNGLVVLAVQFHTTNSDVDQDKLLSITADGIDLDPVDQSPFYHSSAADERARMTGWFLGSGVPSTVFPGDIDFVFTLDDGLDGSVALVIWGIHSEDGNDMAVSGTSTASAAAVTNPQYAQGSQAFDLLAFGCLFSGVNAVGSIAPTTGLIPGDWSQSRELDTGDSVASWINSGDPVVVADEIIYGWTAASDDAGFFGIMVRELGAAANPSGYWEVLLDEE